jgi:hypothetical protein
MNVYQILYLTFLAASLIICFCSYQSFGQNKSLKVFSVLLPVALLTEIIYHTYKLLYKVKYIFIYHAYIPFEYAMLAYFFYVNSSNEAARKFIFYSVPVFMLGSACISIYVVSLDKLPVLNFNFEGILLISWSLITLFSIQPTANLSITRLPVFWVCVGILIFHPGIFLFNGVYDHIRRRIRSWLMNFTNLQI